MVHVAWYVAWHVVWCMIYRMVCCMLHGMSHVAWYVPWHVHGRLYDMMHVCMVCCIFSSDLLTTLDEKDEGAREMLSYLFYCLIAISFASLSAWIVKTFAPYAGGSGIPEIKVAWAWLGN